MSGSRRIRLGYGRRRFPNGTTLQTPRWAGEAVQWFASPGTGRRRLPAEEDLSPEFEAALSELGFRETETLELTLAPGLRAPGPRARADLDDAIVLRPGGRPPADAVPIVLYQDESGGLSWHLPDGFFQATRPTRRASSLSFTIPSRTRAARAAVGAEHVQPPLRGPITKWGRKILKLFLIPVASRLAGSSLWSIVSTVEAKHRSERLRAVTPENYRSRLKDEPDPTLWERLAEGRALLVLHGIFSTTDGMLARMSPSALARLHAAYNGRILAFDHLTVSRSPEENAGNFLTELGRRTPGLSFEFDVLSHSRGGIVARCLAERGSEILPGNRCTFRKVFFVATPNAGSPLADPGHIVDLVDIFTNFLTSLPDGPALYSIEVLLAILKLVAHAAGTELPGISALGTEGYIRDVLNRGQGRYDYAALAADYEPRSGHDNGFFAGRFVDHLADAVFGAEPNDLVVPTLSVHGSNGHPSFPLQNTKVFSPDEHVSHTEFFANKGSFAHLCEHLGIPTLESRSAVAKVNLLWSDVKPNESKEEIGSNLGGMIKCSPEPKMDYPEAMGDEGLIPGNGGEDRQREERGIRAGHLGLRRRDRAAQPAGPRATPPPPPPPPLPPAEEERPEEFSRWPRISFHELMEEGRTAPLIISLEDVPGAASAVEEAMRIEIRPGQESVAVNVVLTAPGFDVAPGPLAQISVRRRRNPQEERAVFQLTARRPGKEPVRQEITAGFFLGNRCIGSVRHWTTVVPKGYTARVEVLVAPPPKAFALDPPPRKSCDWIIVVEGQHDNAGAFFRLMVGSSIHGHERSPSLCGELRLGGEDPSRYLNSFLESYLDRYPDESGSPAGGYEKALKKWAESFVKGLGDLGKKLWSCLPEDFRDLYFQHYDGRYEPRSIFIHSTETVLPWELIIPHRTIDGRLQVLEPLGIRHVLGRAKLVDMRPQPQKFPIRNVCVLNPRYEGRDELPWAQEEAGEMKKLFRDFIQPRPVTDQTVRKVLERGDIQLLHFSGHGDYDPANADLNHLLLEDQDRLNAVTFEGTALAAQGTPIVYLNACDVGRSGYALGRMGGFAANCIDAGCSGVIAPYWAINDRRAKEFALSLYRKLLAGMSFGEALQELRRDHPSEPTYLAYAYFGDPWARVSYSEPPTGPRPRKEAP